MFNVFMLWLYILEKFIDKINLMQNTMANLDDH